jgi:hypothetical protein
MEHPLSEYEQIRNKNIAANELFLSNLGLEESSKKITTKKRKQMQTGDQISQPERQSRRIAQNEIKRVSYQESISKLGAEPAYLMDSNEVMTCNQCFGIVKVNSSNRNFSLRSHQSNCSKSQNPSSKLRNGYDDALHCSSLSIQSDQSDSD